MEIGINYSELVDTALRQVLRGALEQVVEDGMPGDHHFYITFITDFPGVSIPSYLKARYESKMTIVVQHQFHSLRVWDDGFKIALSFSGVSERLEIPFAAVVEFADPFVNFALQFQSLAPDNDAEDNLGNDLDAADIADITDIAEAIDITSQDLGSAKTSKSNKKKGTSSKLANQLEDQPEDQSVEKNAEGIKDSSDAEKEAGNVIALDAYRRS